MVILSQLQKIDNHYLIPIEANLLKIRDIPNCFIIDCDFEII